MVHLRKHGQTSGSQFPTGVCGVGGGRTTEDWQSLERLLSASGVSLLLLYHPPPVVFGSLTEVCVCCCPWQAIDNDSLYKS